VVVGFVDIGGLVDNHSLNSLFITYNYSNCNAKYMILDLCIYTATHMYCKFLKIIKGWEQGLHFSNLTFLNTLV
jgi:hypothetical protein